MVEYPDVSAHQAGFDISGPPFVVARAAFKGVTDGQSNGLSWEPWRDFKRQADKNGQRLAAYHWISGFNIPAEARVAFNNCYGAPMMIDVEENISVDRIIAYAFAYRQLGGQCNLVYYPDWKWDQNGRPDLRPLEANGLRLVSSEYVTSPANAGWLPYGGLTPVIWQFTGDGNGSTRYWNGRTDLDWNRYQGTWNELYALWGFSDVASDDFLTYYLQ